MKKLFILLLSLQLSYVYSNTCQTADTLDVIGSFQPDTVTITDSVYWFTFYSDVENYLYLNSFINGNSDIDSIAVFYNNCNNLIYADGFSLSDSTALKLLAVPSSQYCYIKVIRRQYQGSNQFSIAVFDSRLWIGVDNCPLGNCEFVYNNTFEVLDQSININSLEPFVDPGVCGWDVAWGSPQIRDGIDFINNPLDNGLFMWDNTGAGEAVNTRFGIDPLKELVQGRQYDLRFNYSVENDDDVTIRLVFSNAAFASPALLPGLREEINIDFSSLNLPLYTSWNDFHEPNFTPDENWEFLTIFPVSDGGTFITLRIDNFFISEALTCNITANPTYCNYGTNVTLTANPILTGGYPVNDYDYLWSNGGATTQSIVVNSPGTYEVTVTSPAGCVATAQYIVYKPMQVSLVNEDETCDKDDGYAEVTVTDGLTPYTYVWQNSSSQTISTQDFADNLTAGTYYVTVSDAQGCTWTSSFVIGLDVFTNALWPAQPENTAGGDEVIRDIAVNQNTRDIYSIGMFTEDIFDGTNYELTNNTNNIAIFVSKHDVCGNLQYARLIGYGDNDTNSVHIELLENEMVCVAGDFKSCSFDGWNTTYNANGSTDVFLAVLDNSDLMETSSDDVAILWSGEIDRVRGLTVEDNSIAIVGFFDDDYLYCTNCSTCTLTNNNSGYSDLYIGRFDYSTELTNTWLQNYYPFPNDYMEYSDYGMATAYVDNGSTGYIYFTLRMARYNYPATYITRINATNGNGGLTYSLPHPTSYGQLHEIMDMKAYDGDLYMCGQAYTQTVQNKRVASVYYYEDPNANGYSAWDDVVYSSGDITQPYNNLATRLSVNDDGVYVIGFFNQDKFDFVSATTGDDPANGTSHFVARLTLATLNQDWMETYASGTNGSSFAYGFDVDNTSEAFYVGGTFDKTLDLNSLIGAQSITAYSTTRDGFIGRFTDDGLGATYKNLSLTPSETKSEITIYPNPSNGSLFINTSIDSSSSEISITDISGRVIINDVLSVESEGLLSYDVSVLSEGVYIIKVTNGNNVHTEMLLIKH